MNKKLTVLLRTNYRLLTIFKKNFKRKVENERHVLKKPKEQTEKLEVRRYKPEYVVVFSNCLLFQTVQFGEQRFWGGEKEKRCEF